MIDDGKIAPRTHAGFTMVELMVVVAVLITLIGLSFAAYSLVTSDDRTEAETEIRLIMQALEKYAEQNGGRYPPNVKIEGVEIKPRNEAETGLDDEGEEIEDLVRDRESSAMLFYYLTRHFITESDDYDPETGEAEYADPQILGRRPLTGKGPYLRRGIFGDHQFGLARVGDDDEVDVILPDPGYTGEATWLLDPWGTPYRYVLKDKGRRYIVESAGPDKKFGVTLAKIEEYDGDAEEKEEEEDDDELTEEERLEKLKEEHEDPFEYSDLTEKQREQMRDNIRSYDLE